MRHGDDLDPLIEKTIHNEERKAAKQKPPGAGEVMRPGFGSLANQIDRTIELAPKARGGGLIPFAVPPLRGLGFVCGERVELYRELRHQRAASRRRTSAQGIVLTAPLSSSVTRRVADATRQCDDAIVRQHVAIERINTTLSPSQRWIPLKAGE